MVPFGWGMHLGIVALAIVLLTPPWFFGNVGIYLPGLVLLAALTVWLVRLLAYLGVGLICRCPWHQMFLPWKQALVFPVMLTILIAAANVDVTLRITIALHQAQLDRIAKNIQAGRPIARETMWMYDLDQEAPVSGCVTLRIPQSDEILVYHLDGPPPAASFPFWHLWGDWYEYRHY